MPHKVAISDFWRCVRFSLWMIALLLISCGNARGAEQSGRLQSSFDFDWRFHLGDVAEALESDFDDTGWQGVDLPHDWSVEQPFDKACASGTGYLPGGVGWYRKTFTAPEKWRGREVTLLFDGVYRNSEVWLNGQQVGGRPYGYIPFECRLTSHLRIGQKNVLAVRVARENVADSRWYPGSGIYRHTWLTVTAPVHVARWGVFVTTPRVTDKRADVMVSVDLVGESAEPADVRMETEVLDPAGKSLSRQSTTASLAAGEEKTLAHWQVVQTPKRWSLVSPTLYTAVTRVYRGDVLVDETRTPFGIRTFHFNPNDGFFLNGKPLKVKGVCMHHDAGAVGAAVPDKVLERRLRLVKELGANAVRCSHNPMAEELYTLCDRLGLVVMDEAFDEWELGKRKWVKGRNVGRAERFGYNEAFGEWAERDVADMVRRDRNHPSVILWSIGNEIDYPGDPYTHPEFFDPAAPPVDEGSPSISRLAVVAPRLIAAVKRHDSTRPVTMALSNLPASNDVGLPGMLDVVGYNYQEQFYAQDHAEFPDRVIYGSENGWNERTWQAVAQNDFVSSLYLWTAFDFLGEAGEWPNHGSRSGVYDTRGFLKPYGWLQRVLWSEEPVVQVFVGGQQREGNARRRGGGWLAEQPRLWRAEEGEHVPVFVFTNCEAIKLSLNGKEIETAQPRPGGFFTAAVPFETGELSVAALRDDQSVAHDAIRTPGPAERLELVADRTELTADGQDAAHVEVRVVDGHGLVVSDARQAVTVTVAGAGRLLGVDNGDQNDTTALKSPTKEPRDGRLLAIIESDRRGGEMEVVARAEGLESARIVLPVSQAEAAATR